MDDPQVGMLSHLSSLFPEKTATPRLEIQRHFWNALWNTFASDVDFSKNTVLPSEATFTQFHSNCMVVMFSNVLPERAAILADDAWPHYARADGGLTYASLKAVLRDLYHKYSFAALVKEMVDEQEFLLDLFRHICSAMTVAPDGATVTCSPREFVGMEALDGKRWVVSAPGDVAPLALRFSFPEDVAIDDGYFSEEEEQKYITTPPANRFLLLCPPGTSIGCEVSRLISEHYNCVDLDVCRLAEREVRVDSALGEALRQAAGNARPLNADVQAKLIRSYLLSEEETAYRGYVMHDIPTCDPTVNANFLETSGLKVNRPLWIVDLTPQSEEEWNQMRDLEIETLHEQRQTEMQLRAAEDAEDQRKQAKLEEQQRRLEERRRRRAEQRAAAREAAEAAGEEAPAPPEEEEEEDEPEEPPPAEAEAETEEDRQGEGEGEGEEGQSKGPPLSREERRLLFDLRESVVRGRRQVAQDGLLFDASPLLHDLITHAKHCHAYLKLNPQQPAPAILDCVVRWANSLCPSSVAEAPFWEIAAQPPAAAPADEQARIDELEEKVKDALPQLQARASFAPGWKQFCPVAYVEQGVVVEGSPWYTCIYRGRLYYLSGVEALQKFRSNPHKYLAQPRQKPIPNAPVLVMKRHLDPETDPDLPRRLAARLGYELVGFGRYLAAWQEEKAEQRRRLELAEKQRLEREAAERAERAAAEEARRRERKGKKGPRVEEAEVVKVSVVEEVIEAPADEGTLEAAEEAIGPPPQTPEMRIAKEIEDKVRVKLDRPNIVVDALEFDVAGMEWLYENRLLLETVLLLDGNPSAAAEEEEEAEGDPDPADPEAETPAVVPEPVDLGQPKPYQKYMRRLLKRFREGPSEEELEPEPEPEEGEEAAAELKPQKPPPLPRQTFVIHTVATPGLDPPSCVEHLVRCIDPFHEAAVKADDAEAEGEEEAEEAEEAGPGWGVRPTRPSPYGWAQQYCPVSLARGVLRKGLRDAAVSVDGRLFLCRGDEERAEFLRDPQRFVPAIPAALPPPRLWVVGVRASGRTMLAEALASRYGVPLFYFDRDFFDQCLWPAGKGGREAEGFAEAKRQLKAVDDFDAAEAAKKKQLEDKEQRQKERERRQAAGEEDEDDEDEEDEEEEPWEPEEEDVRKERLLQAYSAVAADILQHEPFKSAGYVMDGYPTTEEEQQALFAQGVFPEKVVALRVSPEQYVRRRVDGEYRRRCAERARRVRELKRQRLLLARRQKRRELKQQRTRNLELEEEEEPEEEEIEEDPAEVDRQDVATDLEAQHGADTTQLEAVYAALEEQALDLVPVAGDRSRSTVVSALLDQLRGTFDYRQSLLEAPQVVRYDKALALLRNGLARLSSFGYRDCVELALERSGEKELKTVRLLPPDAPPEPPEPEVDEEVDSPRTAERKRRFRVARWQRQRLEELREAWLAERRQEREEAMASMEEAAAEPEDEEEEREEGVAVDATGEEEVLAGMEGEIIPEEEQVEAWQGQVEEATEGQGPDFDPGPAFDGEEAEAGEGWPFAALREELEALAKAEEEEVPEEEEEPSPEEEEERLRLEALEARRQQYASWPKACVFRRRVYVFGSDAHLLRFQADPWRYLRQAPPPPPLPPRVVVLPYERPPVPEAEWYTYWRPQPLARQLAHNLQAVYLDEGRLVADLLAHPVPSTVTRELAAFADRPLPDSVLRRALQFRLSLCDAVLQGVVLDGLPRTQSQMQELLSIGVVPTKVLVELEGEQLQDLPAKDHRSGVAAEFATRFKCVHRLPTGALSDWHVVFAALEAVQAALRRQVQRRLLQATGGAVPVYDTCCTLEDLVVQKSMYGAFCPHSWITKQWLVDASAVDWDLRYTALYCGLLYRFAGLEGLGHFLEDPLRYLDPQYALPADLPDRVSSVEAADLPEADVGYQGFCPVTLYHSRDRIGLQGKYDPICIWGQPQYAARYRGQCYRMAGPAELEEFLRQPWLFVDLELPEKIPLKKGLLQGVPMDTYMEHAIYEATVRAMLAVEEARPLFPLLNATESAIKFMAVYMKAHNPNNNAIRAPKYRDNFEQFRECCELLQYFREHRQVELDALRDSGGIYRRKANLWDAIQKRQLDFADFISLNTP